MWSDHRDRTRNAVLGAFATMLSEGNPSTVSMPAVARQAGISVRTLYRYFPNKDALMQAASGWFDEQARTAVGGEVTTGNMRDYLSTLWSGFALDIAAVRAQHFGRAGRDLRDQRLERARASIEPQLPAAVTGQQRSELLDMTIALTSSSMFLELVDRMGHEPARAAQTVARLTEVAMDDAAQRAATGTEITTPASHHRGTSDDQ